MLKQLGAVPGRGLAEAVPVVSHHLQIMARQGSRRGVGEQEESRREVLGGQKGSRRKVVQQRAAMWSNREKSEGVVWNNLP